MITKAVCKHWNTVWVLRKGFILCPMCQAEKEAATKVAPKNNDQH